MIMKMKVQCDLSGTEGLGGRVDGVRDNIKAIHEEIESNNDKENKGKVHFVRDLGDGGRVGRERDNIKAIHEGPESDNDNESKGTVQFVRD